MEDKPRLTGDVVEHYLRRANGLKFCGFACNLKHASVLRDAFVAAGVPCEVIHGELSDDERSAMIARLDRGEIRGLWSVELISEGFDLPEVSCAILCRPTKSLSLHLQQLGRILRLSPGKETAIVLDHAGNLMREGLGAAEQDREWTLEGVKKAKASAETLPAVCQCRECFAMFHRAPICPRCGHELETQERVIKVVKGTLKELSAKEIEEQARLAKARKAKAALIRQGFARGVRNPFQFAAREAAARKIKEAQIISQREAANDFKALKRSELW
jgi:superfamily II DNA or RNA helicase